MKNFRLTIEYDGSAFHGWQIQPDCPTIQDEIQKILSMMTRSDIIVSSSGRTDAGVHALAQVAHFTSDTAITPEKFLIALNSMLPPGILIKECNYTDPDFHARFSARQKTYRYRILNRSLPVAIGRQYLWHIRTPLTWMLCSGLPPTLSAPMILNPSRGPEARERIPSGKFMKRVLIGKKTG